MRQDHFMKISNNYFSFSLVTLQRAQVWLCIAARSTFTVSILFQPNGQVTPLLTLVTCSFDLNSCHHLNRILNVAFCQKVRCGSKNYSKSLSWAENLNFPPKTVNNIFKFSSQDSDWILFWAIPDFLTKSYL